MKFLCIFVAVFISASADSYPEWYKEQMRLRRDVNLSHRVGDNGKVFGTLGQNDAGLFGRAGYEHKIFDDHRGTLNAQAHGTRVLGPYGDSSHLGGSLNWKNSNAAANLDVSKQIHGRTSVNAAAGGSWPVGRNGDFSVQGYYDKTQGMRHDYGGRAVYKQRF